MAFVNVRCVPRIPELLWLQASDDHRSYNISHDRDVTVPRCRKGDGGLSRVMQVGVPGKVVDHIRNAGIFQLFKACICQLDHSLINALVERWHPETNTFHLPIGEAIVTLQDVQMIWGLPIQGLMVTGEWVSETRNVDYWNNLCLEYLVFFPTDEHDHDNLSNGWIKFHSLAAHSSFVGFDEEDEQGVYSWLEGLF
uniref:serine/threonine-protein phosphatase 7 long form homolog n=1 Tax=Erigeron canadensis TaxID=72917 RepID=UPI001CB993C0|nr:serine/threonine-protein phosphatase 7 long form homolog [Erigeron canadensis]